MTEQPPTTYQYKVSLECDQKCVKPSITVYSTNSIHAYHEAIDLLKRTISGLKVEGFTVAPLEVKEK